MNNTKPCFASRRLSAAAGLGAWVMVIAITLAPLASAAPPDAPNRGSLHVGQTTFTNELLVDGEATALMLMGGAGPSLLSGNLQAQSLVFEVYESTDVAVGPGNFLPTVSMDQVGREPRILELEHASLEITANDASFRFHVLRDHEDSLFKIQTAGTEVQIKPADRIVVASDGIKPTSKPGRLGIDELGSSVASEVDKVGDAIYGPWNSSWTWPVYDGPWIIASAAGADNSLSFNGDYVVEFYGVTVRASNQGQSWEIRSGAPEEPLHDDLGPIIGDGARYSNRTFVRLHVQAGAFDLQAINPEGLTQYAVRAAKAATDGQVRMESARGTVYYGGEEYAIDPMTYFIDGRYSLTARAEGEAIALSLEKQTGSGPLEDLLPRPAPATSTQVAVGSVAPLIIVGAAVFLLIVGTGARYWAIRRWDQEDLEAALEGQEYDKAARIGQHLLSRDYANEDAAIGRAIALTKGGDPDQAIVELHERFHEREPSDGVLHYVLGLAHVALNQIEQARAAFSEAVSRTPDLLAELQANPDTAGVLPRSPASGTGPFGPGSAYV